MASTKDLVNSYLTKALEYKANYDDSQIRFIDASNNVKELERQKGVHEANGDTYNAEVVSGRLTQAYGAKTFASNEMLKFKQLYEQAEADYQSKKQLLLSATEQAEVEADEATAREVAAQLAKAKAAAAAAGQTTAESDANAKKIQTYVIWGIVVVVVIVVIVVVYKKYIAKSPKKES